MASLILPDPENTHRMNTPVKTSPRSASGTRLRIGLWLAVHLLVVLLPAPALRAETTASKEYQIKAAFLFNFLQFVEWPATTFPAADSPISIGILGDDPFGTALDAVVRDENVRGRRLVIQRSHRIDDLQTCHLLFICKSEQRRIDGILSRLAARPVFTVSEINGFARQGGIVSLYADGRKIRFEINMGAARRSDLKLSSQLLELGRIVGAETGPGGGS